MSTEDIIYLSATDMISGFRSKTLSPVEVMQATIDRAEQVILLVDSSKFESSSGAIVCGLEEVDVLITDSGIPSDVAEAVRNANVRLIVV